MKPLKIYKLLIKSFLISLILIFGCVEGIELDDIPDVETISVSNIDESSALVKCEVIGGGGTYVNYRGVYYSEINRTPTENDMGIMVDGNLGVYTVNLTNLFAGTEYYVRAYASGGGYEKGYGKTLTFKTDNSIPRLTTKVIEINPTSAVIEGSILSDGGSNVTAKGVCWSKNSNPTLSDNHTSDGSGTGVFTSNLTDLLEDTTYYVRAYATNSIGTAYSNEVSFIARNTITDYDGNIYGTVTIGNQTWMAENLKTTHYADGTPITLVESETAWSALSYTDKAYCFYDNSEENLEVYGALYTWAAAMNGATSSDLNPSGVQGACPDGWHLPSYSEWTVLLNYLSVNGYSGIQGTALKSLTGWYNEGNGTDNFGFTVLPSGYRQNSGTFQNLIKYNETFYWNSREVNSTMAYYSLFGYNEIIVYRNYYYKNYGFSVRCVKD